MLLFTQQRSKLKPAWIPLLAKCDVIEIGNGQYDQAIVTIPAIPSSTAGTFKQLRADGAMLEHLVDSGGTSSTEAVIEALTTSLDAPR